MDPFRVCFIQNENQTTARELFLIRSVSSTLIPELSGHLWEGYILKWWRDFRAPASNITCQEFQKHCFQESAGERRPAWPLQGHLSRFQTPTLRRREAPMTSSRNPIRILGIFTGLTFPNLFGNGTRVQSSCEGGRGASSPRPVALAALQTFSPRNVVS